MDDSSNPLKYLVSGGVGGLCTVLTGHPLDTIKVRLQTMPRTVPPPFEGVLDCAAKTVRAEGVLGLYKGITAPLCAVVPIYAISFFGYGVGKNMVQSGEDDLSPLQLFWAGSLAACMVNPVVVPTERVKCLLQVQIGRERPKYRGPREVVAALYRKGGLRSLYRGGLATLLRDVPASGMYFMTYELVFDSLTDSDTDSLSQRLPNTVLAGGVAGLANWTTGLPADVVKSRLQTAPDGRYAGFRDALAHTLREGGPGALYSGYPAVLIRAFPSSAACFLGFELSMSLLAHLFPED